MKKNIFTIVLSLFLLTFVACNKGTSTEKNTQPEINTAVKYHIETAANDLRYAIKDATPETVRGGQQFIEYAQITIPQTIELCKNLGDTMRLNKLIEIDKELTRVLKDSTISGDILINQVNKAASELDELLKL